MKVEQVDNRRIRRARARYTILAAKVVKDITVFDAMVAASVKFSSLLDDQSARLASKLGFSEFAGVPASHRRASPLLRKETQS